MGLHLLQKDGLEARPTMNLIAGFVRQILLALQITQDIE
jgi:hypothetical protein